MPAKQPRRPWYGIAYYVLGAQGSFFAWILCLLGFCLTWGEAILYALNRKPEACAVGDVLERRPTHRRWVEVEGVELDLRCLAAIDAEGAERLQKDTVLIDQDEAAAVQVRTSLRRVKALYAQIKLQPDDLDRGELWRPWIELDSTMTELVEQALATRRALVVVSESSAATLGSEPEETSVIEHVGEADEPPLSDALSLGDLVLVWQRHLKHRADLLIGSIRTNVTRQGMLTSLPASKASFYEERYGVRIGDMALVVGHRPNEVAYWIFTVVSTVLLFLVVGLFALRKPKETVEAPGDAAEGTTTDTTASTSEPEAGAGAALGAPLRDPVA